MDFKNVDISKLPADIRKQFLQFQVMHAEKKIQGKAKMILCPLLSVFGQSL